MTKAAHDDLRDMLEDWLSGEEIGKKKNKPTIGSFFFFPTKGEKVFMLTSGVEIRGEVVDHTKESLVVKNPVYQYEAHQRVTLILKNQIVAIRDELADTGNGLSE